MFNFFVDPAAKQGDCFIISGSDYNHIVNVLRMKQGEEFLVSCNGMSNLCCFDGADGESVYAKIIEEDYRSTELPIKIYLFQALPKADKMELIIQKCTELGVYSVIPTEMKNCVVKLDDKKKKSKVSRWQAIAESAAKQSKRNIIPDVRDVLSYKQALTKIKELDLVLVPYENERGMAATKEALGKIEPGMSVGILIGPEGGFEENEVALAKEAGGLAVSLGSRILRTETAAIAAVSMCMLHTEMNVGEEQ
ncbi:MAG: 16S rRNA (uracil(1498)-N(3))-methyltransferase [Clostridia bacterium]|nr:16S rRNA (uracil(1498)-N(3))-methyltransferase [Clostridia bacterium]